MRKTGNKVQTKIDADRIRAAGRHADMMNTDRTRTVLGQNTYSKQTEHTWQVDSR